MILYLKHIISERFKPRFRKSQIKHTCPNNFFSYCAKCKSLKRNFLWDIISQNLSPKGEIVRGVK